MTPFARLMTALLTLALPLTVLAGTPSAAAPHEPNEPAATAPGDSRAAPNAYEKQTHRATNKQRAKRGLVKVRRDGCLQRFADRHARRMARQQRIYHQDLGPILSRCGLRAVGENVAMGYPTGRAVVNQGWMRSPGHRANILRGEYRIQAIGSHRGADGARYASQVLARR
ncbi:CAP domain-containing protein [Nocardioides pantholopis]|uniref:CAP domain-containing protein n=1 Tax=Nocardioides pantholopis TaxID=2483798 RepID=UPI000F095623|nr:CAP domain-containing protein [Nocardioides pantholopis]